MRDKTEAASESLSDRLAAVDQRIARMKALNASKGDALALRLIEHAKVERQQILAMMPAAARER